MIAVIFEVEPHAGSADAYFDTAAHLKPLLSEIEGFISVERFESLARPGCFLSLSFWRDEAAVRQCAIWMRIDKRSVTGVTVSLRTTDCELLRSCVTTV